jgi:hypothetical protein
MLLLYTLQQGESQDPKCSNPYLLPDFQFPDKSGYTISVSRFSGAVVWGSLR